jgi:ketosteroid isomerase-like protein
VTAHTIAAMAHSDAVARLGSVYENYGRGDFFVDTDIWHPDVEFVFSDEFPDAGVHKGVEGLPETFSMWLRAWERWEVGLEELHEAPDGRVVAYVTFRGFGRGSGLPVQTAGTHVWSFDGAGLVTRIEIHASRDEANRILG